MEWDKLRGHLARAARKLRRRLELRGREGMRFEDLETRVARRVRSGEVLV